jgi:hypothetical protein
MEVLVRMDLQAQLVALGVTGVMADRVLPASILGTAETAATEAMVSRDALVAVKVIQAADKPFRSGLITRLTLLRCISKCASPLD